MTARWSTKYGPRRIRHEPPTLEEALFAAEGLASGDVEQQIVIAAELMDVPVEVIRSDAQRILKGSRNRMTITAGGRRGSLAGATTVVVERKPAKRRIVAPARPGSATAPLVRRG